MKTTFRLATAILVSGCIGMSMMTTGALASGGTDPGGVSGSGGSGGGGTTPPVAAAPVYKVVPMINAGAYYSTNTAAGQVTFGYKADGSYKSMNFNLSGIKLPDGSVLKVTCYMTRPSPVAYYGVATTQSLCSIVVHNGVGTLDLSTTNGNVLDFPLPGGGSTQIYITPANGSFDLTCSFGAAVRKGGRP